MNKHLLDKGVNHPPYRRFISCEIVPLRSSILHKNRTVTLYAGVYVGVYNDFDIRYRLCYLMGNTRSIVSLQRRATLLVQCCLSH